MSLFENLNILETRRMNQWMEVIDDGSKTSLQFGWGLSRTGKRRHPNVVHLILQMRWRPCDGVRFLRIQQPTVTFSLVCVVIDHQCWHSVAQSKAVLKQQNWRISLISSKFEHSNQSEPREKNDAWTKKEGFCDDSKWHHFLPTSHRWLQMPQNDRRTSQRHRRKKVDCFQWLWIEKLEKVRMHSSKTHFCWNTKNEIFLIDEGVFTFCQWEQLSCCLNFTKSDELQPLFADKQQCQRWTGKGQINRWKSQELLQKNGKTTIPTWCHSTIMFQKHGMVQSCSNNKSHWLKMETRAHMVEDKKKRCHFSGSLHKKKSMLWFSEWWQHKKHHWVDRPAATPSCSLMSQSWQMTPTLQHFSLQVSDVSSCGLCHSSSHFQRSQKLILGDALTVWTSVLLFNLRPFLHRKRAEKSVNNTQGLQTGYGDELRS